MKACLKKYNRHQFEDWGITCSDDYKAFSRAFKKYVADEGKEYGWTVAYYNCNHYDTSMMVKNNDGKFVYISYMWDRYSPVDIHASGCMNGILVRTAAHEKDWHGGTNHFTSFADLGNEISRIFERGW